MSESQKLKASSKRLKKDQPASRAVEEVLFAYESLNDDEKEEFLQRLIQKRRIAHTSDLKKQVSEVVYMNRKKKLRHHIVDGNPAFLLPCKESHKSLVFIPEKREIWSYHTPSSEPKKNFPSLH
jgi:hypothetical protein